MLIIIVFQMESVSSACGEYLVSNMNPDTCLAVRATPGIAADKSLVERVDRYIQQLVSESVFGVVYYMVHRLHVICKDFPFCVYYNSV